MCVILNAIKIHLALYKLEEFIRKNINLFFYRSKIEGNITTKSIPN